MEHCEPSTTALTPSATFLDERYLRGTWSKHTLPEPSCSNTRRAVNSSAPDRGSVRGLGRVSGRCLGVCTVCVGLQVEDRNRCESVSHSVRQSASQ